ncbi:SigE family RNA polymerase sigma factor [Isoptericola sp. b441]|uniref:SigE family RNA polymerase sigma factor n=1 Tax=Actinotalea lenta TaxID=3064654 RepID=A0ABT9DD18_9CELL|nr:MULTISPECIES: SigE family RNA polymerase sigma factor [unclassified Isoptericola]MDO8107231.1 SigE family RNA polymerase sigma factor [Isoptericola sp. b441]MDO8121106.1 SigE family RNA polymerase sigma factor [Isoptericola sp. b490]
MQAPDGFADFVAERSPALVRSAWLLTGNEASAQDLVQVALAKTWERWDRVTRKDAPEAYVRRVMMSTFLTWRRRRWHGELPAAELPDRPPHGATSPDMFAAVDLRASMLDALRTLPRRQRAVVVLRYLDDLTEAQTAQALGCSVGTVKSQSAKALASLRASARLHGIWDEEVSHDGH